jgi:hypothetical protein
MLDPRFNPGFIRPEQGLAQQRPFTPTPVAGPVPTLGTPNPMSAGMPVRPLMGERLV